MLQTLISKLSYEYRGAHKSLHIPGLSFDRWTRNFGGEDRVGVQGEPVEVARGQLILRQTRHK